VPGLATRIVELDRGQLRVWPGSYDEYVLQKRAALEVEAKHAALFDKKLAQEEVWIRQGVEARRTRNEGRVRALKQLRIQRARTARAHRAGGDSGAGCGPPSGKLVFEAVHVTHTFGGPPVIADFSARIQRLDRIGIIGPNGCGKTTLIKLLVGDLEPTSGEIRRGTNLLPAYFDQQREQLNPAASIMDNVTGGSGDTVHHRWPTAARVGATCAISCFRRSGCVRRSACSRAASATACCWRGLFAAAEQFLVMDEPTNDLDADTLELLEDMVANYAGTLLLVSHDRAFSTMW